MVKCDFISPMFILSENRPNFILLVSCSIAIDMGLAFAGTKIEIYVLNFRTIIITTLKYSVAAVCSIYIFFGSLMFISKDFRNTVMFLHIGKKSLKKFDNLISLFDECTSTKLWVKKYMSYVVLLY